MVAHNSSEDLSSTPMRRSGRRGAVVAQLSSVSSVGSSPLSSTRTPRTPRTSGKKADSSSQRVSSEQKPETISLVEEKEEVSTQNSDTPGEKDGTSYEKDEDIINLDDTLASPIQEDDPATGEEVSSQNSDTPGEKDVSSNKKDDDVSILDDPLASPIPDDDPATGDETAEIHSDRLSTHGNADSEQDMNDCVLMVDLDCDEEIYLADQQANELIDRSGFSADVLIPTSRDAILHRNIVVEEEIELSGDEEEKQSDADVRLVCLKRPAPVETTIECLEILDSDEEFPVCVRQAEKCETVNVEEKSGYVKEYIESEGLAIIHSHDNGLVLFHLENVLISGEKLDLDQTRKALTVGSSVYFYDRVFEGPEYRSLTKEEVVLQAVVVWKGVRPKHLMKIVDGFDNAFWNKLELYRKTFLLYLRGEVFLPLAFVRTKGTVKGYLNPDFGIIEVFDEDRVRQNVFFHSSDVKIYRNTVDFYQRKVYEILPVGLNVTVDARVMHMQGVKNLKYQAVIVFAGPWPIVPHPTLLPGGTGSYSPTFELLEDPSTFYYLELSLETNLRRKVNDLREHLSNLNGVLKFEWRGVSVINTKAEFEQWQQNFGQRARIRKLRHTPFEKRQTTHTFKAPIIRRFKTKDEMDTDSFVGNPGSAVGSISGVSSYGSRTQSRLSNFSESSSMSQTKQVRTWYNPETYALGGLRIKKEVKTEVEEDTSQPVNKRLKMEC